MDIVLLIVDSLRAASVPGLGRPGETANAPFLASLPGRMTAFTRAFTTECWTLPTHASMFTGLLPSEHGAHFQTMAYRNPAPTIAELLADRGYATELVTRNPVLDGTLPGITRGFQRQTQILSPRSHGVNPLALMLALSKPRFRQQIAKSGFFHDGQRASRQFVRDFAKGTVPADRDLLEYLVDRMRAHREQGRRFFLCANLFDVHAPYPPTPTSIFRGWRSWRDWEENLTMPFVLPLLGSHRYLRLGFQLRERSRTLLLGRYHDAITLMDRKLAWFLDALHAHGLLDDLLLVITSDHGEAFGEHGLYFHDASVYQTHLHVPLFVHHPAQSPVVVPDVVSTRDLFTLLRAIGRREGIARTLLDPAHRQAHPVAYAEHFHYPRAPWMDERYRHDLRAVIVGGTKVVRRGMQASYYDLQKDARERSPVPVRTEDIEGSGVVPAAQARWLGSNDGLVGM